MLSIPHLIIIFVVALIVFGPEKLPELARNLGKVMAEFRRHTGDLRSTFEGHLRDIEREGETRRIAPPIAGPVASPAAGADAPKASTTAVENPPTPSATGTVPSNAPNAAAIAGTSGELFPEPRVPNAGASGLQSNDIGHDPYLMGTEFAPDLAPYHEQRNPPEPVAPEENSERVSDGDHRPA
jgi:TatA/E family protein of Tat protein translocase